VLAVVVKGGLVVDISVLRTALVSGEGRYRRALERVETTAASTHQAQRAVESSRQTLWREVVRSRSGDPAGHVATLQRNQVAGRAVRAFDNLGQELSAASALAEQLSQETGVAASLQQGVSALTTALARAERREQIRRDTIDSDEISEIAALARLGERGVGLFEVASAQPAVSPLLANAGSGSVAGQSYPTAVEYRFEGLVRNVWSDNPVGRPGEVIAEASMQPDAAPVVRLSLVEPNQRDAAAAVAVTTDTHGGIVADVTIASHPLAERVSEQREEILRKLDTLDLSISELHVSYGVVGDRDGERRKRSGLIGLRKKRREEEDDEASIS
jgi:hypothetical protein